MGGRSALSAANELDDTREAAAVINTLGESMRAQGNYDRAEAYYTQALHLTSEYGEYEDEIANIYKGNLATVAFHQNKYEESLSISWDILQYCYQVFNSIAIATNLVLHAAAFEGLGRVGDATRLLGAAQTYLDEIGHSLAAADQLLFEETQAAVQDELPEGEFERLWAEGEALSLDESVALALEESNKEEEA